MRLTEISIANLKAPERGATLYHDDTLTGFSVRVSQAGTKSFCLTMGRNRERVTIGRVGILTLKEARDRAREMLAEQTLGKTRGPRIRLGEALESFLTTHAARLRPRTQKELRRLLTKHLAKLKHDQLDQITTHRLTKIVDGLSKTPGEAEHLHRVAKTFFRWAVRRRLLQHSPLEELEAPPKAQSRDRVLSDEELAQVLSIARKSGQFGVIVQFLLFTGQRKGEITGLRREMVDAEAQTIMLPAALVKNKRQHVFPYGPAVVELLEALPKEGLLFRGRRRAKAEEEKREGEKDEPIPFNGYSKGMAEFREDCKIAHWTLHDLRRTLATGMARLGVQPHCIEALLNHVSGTLSPVTQIYNRHKYLPEARAAAALWEKHIASLPKTS